MNAMICLAAGSLVGGFARWLLSDAVSRGLGGRFPFGTLAVNLSGCFLIGALQGLGESRLGAQGRMLLMTGFCGAFTTFSAFILEASVLFKDGNIWHALAYIFMSLIVCLVAFSAGALAGKAFS